LNLLKNILKTITCTHILYYISTRPNILFQFINIISNW